MKRIRKCFPAAVAATLFAIVPSAQGITIDTLTGWNGTDFIFFFGEPNTATYGQTITIGVENVLKSFTFVLDQTSFDPVHFRAYVMEWNDVASLATGPVLFSSGNLQTTGAAGYETFQIDTGNLLLNSGSDYVLFFNTSNNFDTLVDRSNWASRAGADTYPDGLFVYNNNGNAFANLSSVAWNRDYQGLGTDLAFRAELVPEPANLILLALGALAWTATGSRRRKYRVR